MLGFPEEEFFSCLRIYRTLHFRTPIPFSPSSPSLSIRHYSPLLRLTHFIPRDITTSDRTHTVRSSYSSCYMNPIFNIGTMLPLRFMVQPCRMLERRAAARHSGASSRLRLANDYIGNFGEKRADENVVRFEPQSKSEYLTISYRDFV